MLVLRRPDRQEKMALLAESARFEVCGSEEGYSTSVGAGVPAGPGSPHPDHLPLDGVAQKPHLAEQLEPYLFQPAARSSAPLLKVLLTDACRNNCLYCAFRAGMDRRRTAFKPEELAGGFVEMHRRGQASGLFLSSGCAGDSVRTMEAMLRTVEILRHRHHFPGYIHLKILPEATDDYLEAACRLADRVSANLEAPNPARLAAIAPGKDFQGELLDPLRRVAAIRKQGGLLSFGTTTQFVVGAADESDAELLEATGRLYAEVDLTRAHFSAFRPLPGTPLEEHPPTSPVRQRRLYQADSLIRQYGFSASEIPMDEGGNLLYGRDPKLEWAHRHPERFPVEVNRATREELLRVPGIGPRGVAALLRARRSGQFSGGEALRGLPVVPSRAAPFLLVNGRRLAEETLVQGELGL